MTDPINPVERLLAKLENVKPLPAGGWLASCPGPRHRHGDRRPSLKVDRGDEDQALIHCHAGCDPEEILKPIGLTLADLFPPSDPAKIVRNGRGRRVVRTTRYPVPTADGTTYAVHVRDDFDDGSKSFRWKTADGRAGLGGIKLSDLALYHTSDVGISGEAIVVEGEKSADAGATLLSVPFLGTVSGASGTPGDAALRQLLGRTVYLWPDNDDPGWAHMDRVARRLLELGQPPERVRLIDWQRAPEKGDAADWVAKGGDANRLRTRLDAAPVWNADREPEEPSRALSHAQILALDLPPARPLAAGLIEEDCGCIIAGPGGTGKTWLAVDLARCVAGGIPWLGHFPTNAVPVLYIDEEGNERLLQNRLRLLNAAQPLVDPPLWFTIGLGLKIDHDATRAVIEEEIARYQPGLVVFDSLTRAHSANENDASEMSRVFARFSELRRRYGCAVVLIDHVRKKGLFDADAAEMLRGSTDKRNWPDSIIFATPAERGTLTISHVKARFGEPVPDFTVALEIDNDAGEGRVRYQGQAPSQDITKGNEILAAIHALKAQLGEDAADVTKIAAWLDVSHHTVRRYVKKMLAASILRARTVTTDGRPKEVYDVLGGVQ